MDSPSEKARDTRARRAARRTGLTARTSRARAGSVDNWGGFMLVNDRNCVEAGEHYDLTAEQVIDYCRDGGLVLLSEELRRSEILSHSAVARILTQWT